MAFCGKCGTQMADGTAFCPSCGAAQGGGGSTGAGGGSQVQSTGMDEKLAALLSYVVGWVTGIIFLVIDKRPYVRFHAAQSIVVFGGLHIINIVLSYAFGFGWFFGGWGALGWASSWSD